MTARDLLDFPDAAPLLVGREREQARLRDLLGAALAGRGGLVLIGGEAGIGKTTLADALCRDAEHEGAVALVGRCYDLTETPPYGPWLDLFARYQPADDAPPLPEAFQQRGTVGAVTSQAALFHQVQDFLIALAAQQSVLVLLDDLHWADPASLDLLRFLARSLSTLPLLMLATYRADELTRRHPLYQLLPVLVREAPAHRFDLQRIEERDVRTLVAARYPLPVADATRLVTYLHQRAEGNPFFLGELVQTLEAERVLRRIADGWTLGDLTQTRVPALLRQVIDGRLARLDEMTQRLLAVAAVIGQEVPLALWAAVAETNEETLSTVVEQAIEAHVMEESPDGAQIRFAHALIREALYEGTLSTRRRALHRRVGEALAISSNPEPDAVAYHFRQAGDARAAEWMIKAGERAQRTYAWITAAERYEAAIALMGEGGLGDADRGWILYRLARLRRYSDPRSGIAHMDEAMQWATDTNDRALRALVAFDRGLLHAFAGNIRTGLVEMEAGVTALESLADEDLERLAAKNFEGARESVGGYRGTVVLWLAEAGYHARALEMGNLMIVHAPAQSAIKARGSSAYADAYNGLGFAHAALGHWNEALSALMQGRAYHRAAEAFTMLGAFARIQLTYVTLVYDADNLRERRRLADEGEQAYVRASGAWANLPPRVAYVPLLLLSGDWGEAEQLTRIWLSFGSAQGEGLKMLATLACHRGDRDQAWELLRKAFPDGLATAPGDVLFLESVAMQHIAIMLALDEEDFATARSWLEMHDRWLDWGEAVQGQSEGQALWAAFYRATGDPKRAHDHAQQALSHATEPRQPLALIAAHRLLGELNTDAGRYAGAETHLNTSLALADACAAPYERALTLLAIAALHVATDKRAEAQTSLDESRAICTPLGAKPALARADALAAKLTGAAKPAPVYPAGLSAREVEVLRLVADGLTNVQVADRLFLSPHTINSHLTAIYTKLGVPSRSAAIRFALDHDLR